MKLAQSVVVLVSNSWVQPPGPVKPTVYGQVYRHTVSTCTVTTFNHPPMVIYPLFLVPVTSSPPVKSSVWMGTISMDQVLILRRVPSMPTMSCTGILSTLVNVSWSEKKKKCSHVTYNMHFYIHCVYFLIYMYSTCCKLNFYILIHLTP